MSPARRMDETLPASRSLGAAEVRPKPDTTAVRLKPDTTYVTRATWVSGATPVRLKPDTTYVTRATWVSGASPVRLKPDTTHLTTYVTADGSSVADSSYVVSGFSRTVSWTIVCLLVVVTAACSRPGGAPTSDSVSHQPATLRPVALPDLLRMENGVQEQMRAAHASLTKKIDEARPPAELAAAYGEMGNLLMAAEYLDAAEPCYQNARALAPGESRWPYYLGHVYRTRGELANAAHAFEQALAIGPADVATLVWLGVAYLDLGKPSDAAPLFARALVLEPRSVAALSGQGRAALANRDYLHAAESFERALSIDARASMIHYPLALAYRGLGEMDKAEAQARQRGEVEIGPSDPRMQELSLLLHSATSYEKRGLRALDGGDWAGAASAFGQAVALTPENATLHHRLGTALSLSGDAAGAAREFQEAIRLSPTYAPAHFSLGLLLTASGRHAEAVERFAAAVRYEPENADARLQLAAALVRAQRYQDAKNQLLEGARRNPERPEFSRLLEQFRPVK